MYEQFSQESWMAFVATTEVFVSWTTDSNIQTEIEAIRLNILRITYLCVDT
jgi:hypothetical protein